MLRVFGPPEDRVKDIFYGSQGGGTQERKVGADKQAATKQQIPLLSVQ